jgi:hypothetical protein
MKNNKVTAIFDEEDAKKFIEISKRTRWEDRFIVSVSLRYYYKIFSKDWKKAVIDALEEKPSSKEES